MTNIEELNKQRLSFSKFNSLSTEDASSYLAAYVEMSLDLGQVEWLEEAIRFATELRKRDLTVGESASLHFVEGNAWSGLQRVRRQDEESQWAWEQEEIEHELIHYRSALQSEGLLDFPDDGICSLITNTANQLNHIGRFIEAQEFWDKALLINPEFAMALGNKGMGLMYYAGHVYDDGHRDLILKFAHACLKEAITHPLEKPAKEGWGQNVKEIESYLTEEFLSEEIDLESYSLGDTKEEEQYRKWCLENRLFLNPLNDLGAFPIANRDITTAPSMAMVRNTAAHFLGLYNQIKQEYVSARFLFYDSIDCEGPHFSDRDVYLYNTLDYPAYSLSTEKGKAAFRIAYSLFDKIAFFLNSYLELAIPERQIAFRTLWYKGRKKDKGLRDEFVNCPNWPLRGLFWLSKDLYEKMPGFHEAIEPEAQQLAEIRNHVEHKYLKLHDSLFIGEGEDLETDFKDSLAFSISRSDFEDKTLKILKMVRAALLYLAFGIHSEEKRRRIGRDQDAVFVPMMLDEWDDDWKL